MLSRSLRTTGFIEPCLPTLARVVPDGPQWAHEIKHDGYRMICRRDGDRVRVFTRRGHDWTNRVPRIAEALASLRVSSATIDGEGVLCDAQGVTDFDRLRGALARRGGSREPFLYAFDLIELNGTDLRPQAVDRPARGAGGHPSDRRRWRRHRIVRTLGRDARLGNFQVACGMGLQGIVSKRLDRPYRSGRSPDWIKVKNPDAPAAFRVIEH
jgi:ATP-dependent DNA ligase